MWYNIQINMLKKEWEIIALEEGYSWRSLDWHKRQEGERFGHRVTMWERLDRNDLTLYRGVSRSLERGWKRAYLSRNTVKK